MTLKHLVLALAVAAACAVAPSSPRGSTEAVGDTFEMSLAKATLAVTPKLRGASEGHRPAGRGLDFGQYQTGKPTAAPTAEPTAASTAEPTPAPTLPVGGPAAAACLDAPGGDCDSCCGGCTRKTPEVDGLDFRDEGQCVCFEGTLPGKARLTLTNSNDCAKVRVTGEDGKIYARARCQSRTCTRT